MRICKVDMFVLINLMILLYSGVAGDKFTPDTQNFAPLLSKQYTFLYVMWSFFLDAEQFFVLLLTAHLSNSYELWIPIHRIHPLASKANNKIQGSEVIEEELDKYKEALEASKVKCKLNMAYKFPIFLMPRVILIQNWIFETFRFFEN